MTVGLLAGTGGLGDQSYNDMTYAGMGKAQKEFGFNLIVEEAGGRVTDMFGRPLDFAADYKMRNNRGVVVSNGSIHAAVIEVLSNRG